MSKKKKKKFKYRNTIIISIVFLFIILTVIYFARESAVLFPDEYAKIEVDTTNFKPNLVRYEELVIPYTIKLYTRNWDDAYFRGWVFFYVDGEYVSTKGWETGYQPHNAGWVDDQNSFFSDLKPKRNYYLNLDETISTTVLEPGEHFVEIYLINQKPEDDYEDLKEIAKEFMDYAKQPDKTWKADSKDKMLDYNSEFGTKIMNLDDRERLLFTIFKPEDLPGEPEEPEEEPDDTTDDTTEPSEEFKFDTTHIILILIILIAGLFTVFVLKNKKKKKKR